MNLQTALVEALKSPYHAKTVKRFISDLSGSPVMKTQIKGIIGRSDDTVVFETQKGLALKLTKGSQFRLNRPVETFDAPVYSRGSVNNTHYCFEELCSNKGLKTSDVKKVIDCIKAKGYRVYDLDEFDVHQIGKSADGKLYLVDHECAKYKTIFHKLFLQIKSVFGNKN